MPIRDPGLWRVKEAAAIFQVPRATIGGLITALGISPKRMEDGRSKGLDVDDMRSLARSLGRTFSDELAATA